METHTYEHMWNVWKDDAFFAENTKCQRPFLKEKPGDISCIFLIVNKLFKKSSSTML